MSHRTPLPRWLALPAALAMAVVSVPIVALLIRVPWSSAGTLLRSEEASAALGLSLGTASVATAISLIIGVPLGLMLARMRPGIARFMHPLVTLPVVLPPVAGGVALLLAYGRQGVVGGPLDDAFGITIPFTTVAVVLAQLLVALPFTVLSVEAAAQDLDVRFDEAAATLGAGPTRTLFWVTLPALRPAILAGSALTFARALGELGATLIFAGSLPNITRTVPLEVLLQLDQADAGRASVLSLALLAISAVTLVALRGRWVSVR